MSENSEVGDAGSSLLSELIIHTKFARYLPEHKRRERWTEITQRNLDMHLRRFNYLSPEDQQDIKDAYQLVVEKKILPSMRSMQLAGGAIERHHNRIYNCAYVAVDCLESFREIFFLLLGGSGVGFSVQKHHVAALGSMSACSNSTYDYVIQDTIEGWALAGYELILSYYTNSSADKGMPIFDYSKIRPEGTLLKTTGGKAPGPEPLRKALNRVRKILDTAMNSDGRQLTPLQCHDILCHLSDSVSSGGIRRAALISLFSIDDGDMITCKSGVWWKENAQRGRSNNSVVLDRKTVTKDDFLRLWKKVEESHSGEPGLFWTDNVEWGLNPCGEISLRYAQCCNLCDVNISNLGIGVAVENVDDKENVTLCPTLREIAYAKVLQTDFEKRCRAAAIIGTLQASYTDFPSNMFRDVWRQTCEEEALLGISLNGIAGSTEKLDLVRGVGVIKETNIAWASKIGINPAKRLTCVKPSGDSSLVLGCSPGVHSYHSDYYIRAVKFKEDEKVVDHLYSKMPVLMEISRDDPAYRMLNVPVKAPKGSITREETALEFLERVLDINKRWIVPGHVGGDNKNNVSATVSIREYEWDNTGEWMWYHRGEYTGLACMPHCGGTYTQAPYQKISEWYYHGIKKWVRELGDVIEETDGTNVDQEVACAGGACEWKR